MTENAEPEIIATIELNGFDPEGEPEIRVMSDGSVYVVFNFMPPSDSPDPNELGQFENFDVQMQEAIGVPVMWEDREMFLIEQSDEDTVARIKKFVENYRK